MNIIERIKPFWRPFFYVPGFIVYFFTALWTCGAVWYLGWQNGGVKIAATLLTAAVMAAPVFIRPYRTVLSGGALALFSILLLQFVLRTPDPNRNWMPEYSRMPQARFDVPAKGQITVEQVRDFRYRSETDFDVRYRTVIYDPDKLNRLDFIVVHWDGMLAIGHTMLSFGFSNGDHVVFSFETRRDNPDLSGSLPGLYKQFQLACIVGTERDLLELRTNHRKEKVLLYETNATGEQRKTLFLNLLRRCNQLKEHPEFYNTLLHNCTTSLLPGIENVAELPRRNPAFLWNGFSDVLAFELGFLKKEPSDILFENLQRQSYINPKVENIADPADYSERIRKPLLPRQSRPEPPRRK